MTIKGIDIITPTQCKAARAGLDMSAETLAKLALIHRVTLNKFEKGKTLLHPTHAASLKKALENAGAEFPDLETVRFPQTSRMRGSTVRADRNQEPSESD